MLLKNVHEGWNAQKCAWRLKCSKMCMKAWMSVLKCIYQKCIFAKCTRLACLLSFANLFTCVLESKVLGLFPPDKQILFIKNVIFWKNGFADTQFSFPLNSFTLMFPQHIYRNRGGGPLAPCFDFPTFSNSASVIIYHNGLFKLL